MSAMASTSASMASQPVVLTTQTQYPLPTQKFMLPISWKRYQLSQLVNKALSLAQPVPFDFIIRGEVLRTTLAEWCAEHSVGEEETLEIEYVEAVMPPQKMSEFPHEDWVSSVSCHLQGYFLTASYDGQIRAFDYSKNLASSAAAHAAPITSICVIPSTINEESTHTVASASHDLSGLITKMTFNSPASTSTPLAQHLASLHLHTAPLTSIASNSAGSHLLTSSWDGLIGFWDTLIPSTDEVPEEAPGERERKKRRRVDAGGKPKRKAPLLVLKSHTARVSKATFGQDAGEATAYSCGFDSTVRVWDTKLGVCTRTIAATEKPFLDMAMTNDGHNTLVTSSDRTATLYDFRASTVAAQVSLLHAATPSCVSLGGSENQAVTGAYDGVVRLWDMRSTKAAMAAFKVWDGNKKVLSVDWKRGMVGVGGEGGLEVWKLGEEKT